MPNEILSSRIREGLDALKLSERKACLNAGLHVDTIRRIRNGQRVPADVLIRLADVLHLPRAYLTEAEFQPPTSARALALLNVPVVGYVQAGEFREAIEFPLDDRYLVTVPTDPRYPGVRLFALEVRGQSMNRLYPSGSIVICARFFDLGRNPNSGEKVVCLRRNATGMEATVKIYQYDEQRRHVLWPSSTEPEFQAPIVLPGPDLTIAEADLPGTVLAGNLSHDAGADDVAIVALVTQSVRRE
jgi:repressor LexA